MLVIARLQTEFHTPTVIRDRHRKRMRQCVHNRMYLYPVHENSLRVLAPAIDLDAQHLPPGRIGTVVSTDVHAYPVVVGLAREAHPKKGSVLVIICFAVILI